MIIVTILHQQLKEAGIIFDGVNSNGEVWAVGGERIHERSDVASLIAKHIASASSVDVDAFGIPAKEFEEFALPIKAPSITAGDYFIESPKPKENWKEAHAEIVKEHKKEKKSIGIMVMNSVKYFIGLQEEIEKLRAEVDELKIKVKTK